MSDTGIKKFRETMIDEVAEYFNNAMQAGMYCSNFGDSKKLATEIFDRIFSIGVEAGRAGLTI